MAKCLVIGSNGFIGRNICLALRLKKHDVFAADRSGTGIYIDLSNPDTIELAIESLRPDYVINAAGVVENSEKANLNPIFTDSLLSVISDSKHKPKRVIVIGSAAEYGEVVDGFSVAEDSSLNAKSPYAISKMQETKIAEEYSVNAGIDIVVARVFNPIGPGMGPKFLVSNILKQLADNSDVINISRVDSKRDYVDVRDVADAIVCFVESESPNHHVVQNIGSGKSTTNGELVNLILSKLKLSRRPIIIETLSEPEKTFAAKADISRIEKEFGWRPHRTLNDSITEIINGAQGTAN